MLPHELDKLSLVAVEEYEAHVSKKSELMDSESK